MWIKTISLFSLDIHYVWSFFVQYLAIKRGNSLFNFCNINKNETNKQLIQVTDSLLTTFWICKEGKNVNNNIQSTTFRTSETEKRTALKSDHVTQVKKCVCTYYSAGKEAACVNAKEN